MTDTIDVLVKWRDVILAAVNSWDILPYLVDGCIRDLADEVRLLREKLAAQEPDATPGPRCGDCALRVESGPLAGECHSDPDPRPENPACEFFERRELLK